MSKKSTDELNDILASTHMSCFDTYVNDNKESMLSNDRPFCDYMHMIIEEKGIKQQDIFLEADISEKYGYKLLSEQKRTKQRDVILRICYAAGLSLEETQRALRIYGMPQLYPKIPRDAFLMVIFNDRPGNVIQVNAILKKNGFESLRPCGVQE